MKTDTKTALITGSGQNIGRGIAHHLAKAGFNIILNGSLDTKISHNLNLCFPNLEAETMIMRMKGVACSMGSACSSATLKPSHVIKALGIDSELAHSAIRFSVGRFTTNDDISNAINEINNTVDTLKAEKQKRGKIFL